MGKGSNPKPSKKKTLTVQQVKTDTHKQISYLNLLSHRKLTPKRKYVDEEEKQMFEYSHSQMSSPSTKSKRLTKEVMKDHKNSLKQDKRTYRKLGRRQNLLVKCTFPSCIKRRPFRYDSRKIHFMSKIHQKDFKGSSKLVDKYLNNDDNLRKALLIVGLDNSPSKKSSIIDDDGDYDDEQEGSFISNIDIVEEGSKGIGQIDRQQNGFTNSNDKHVFDLKMINDDDRIKPLGFLQIPPAQQVEAEAPKPNLDKLFSKDTQKAMYHILSYIDEKTKSLQGVPNQNNMTQIQSQISPTGLARHANDIYGQTLSHPSLVPQLSAHVVPTDHQMPIREQYHRSSTVDRFDDPKINESITILINSAMKQNFQEFKQVNDSLQDRLSSFETTLRDMKHNFATKDDLMSSQRDLRDWFERQKSDKFNICSQNVLDSLSILSALVFIIIHDSHKYRNTILKGIADSGLQLLKQVDVNKVMARLAQSQFDADDGVKDFLKSMQSSMTPLMQVLRNLQTYVFGQDIRPNDHQILVSDHQHMIHDDEIPQDQSLEFINEAQFQSKNVPSQPQLSEDNQSASITMIKRECVDNSTQQNTNAQAKMSDIQLIKPQPRRNDSMGHQAIDVTQSMKAVHQEVACQSDLHQQQPSHQNSIFTSVSQMTIVQAKQPDIQARESKTQVQTTPLKHLPVQAFATVSHDLCKKDDQLMINHDAVDDKSEKSNQLSVDAKNGNSKPETIQDMLRNSLSDVNSLSSSKTKPAIKSASQFIQSEPRPFNTNLFGQMISEKDIQSSAMGSSLGISSVQTLQNKDITSQVTKSQRHIEEERVQPMETQQAITDFETIQAQNAGNDHQKHTTNHQLSIISQQVTIENALSQSANSEKTNSASKKHVQFANDTKDETNMAQVQADQGDQTHTKDHQKPNTKSSNDEISDFQLQRLQKLATLTQPIKIKVPIEFVGNFQNLNYLNYENRLEKDLKEGMPVVTFAELFKIVTVAYYKYDNPFIRYSQTKGLLKHENLEYQYNIQGLVCWLEDAALFEVLDIYSGIKYNWIVPVKNDEATRDLMAQAYEQFNLDKAKENRYPKCILSYNVMIKHSDGVILQGTCVIGKFTPLSHFLLENNHFDDHTVMKKLNIASQIINSASELHMKNFFVNNLSLDSILFRLNSKKIIEVLFVDMRYGLLPTYMLRHAQMPFSNLLNVTQIQMLLAVDLKKSKFVPLQDKKRVHVIAPSNQLDLTSLCYIILMLTNDSLLANNFLDLYKLGKTFPSLQSTSDIIKDDSFVGIKAIVKTVQYLFNRDKRLYLDIATKMHVFFIEELEQFQKETNKTKLRSSSQRSANDDQRKSI